MKKLVIVLVVAMFLFTGMAWGKVTPDTVHDGSVAAITTAVGYGSNVDLGGRGPYTGITCFIVGTAGTLNVDIDGSLDGTTYYGMYDDIVAVGGFSVVNNFYNYYQVDVDACSGACSITSIKCQPKEAL